MQLHYHLPPTSPLDPPTSTFLSSFAARLSTWKRTFRFNGTFLRQTDGVFSASELGHWNRFSFRRERFFKVFPHRIGRVTESNLSRLSMCVGGRVVSEKCEFMALRKRLRKPSRSEDKLRRQFVTILSFHSMELSIRETWVSKVLIWNLP